MGHISFTDLRANMAAHLDRVLADRANLIVTRQNREPIVIMPLAELESLQETLYLLSTPANADHLRRSIAQLERGEGVERALLDE